MGMLSNFPTCGNSKGYSILKCMEVGGGGLQNLGIGGRFVYSEFWARLRGLQKKKNCVKNWGKGGGGRTWVF